MNTAIGIRSFIERGSQHSVRILPTKNTTEPLGSEFAEDDQQRRKPHKGQNPFYLDDSLQQRSDLTKRSETKFRFQSIDLPRIYSHLSSICQQQVFSGGSSQVHSIYFDTHNLSCCQANLDGLSRREKFRIRWYDRPSPSDEFYLELKWRQNRVTGKHRYRISGNLPLHRLGKNPTQSQLLAVAPQILKPAILKFPIPIVHIVYDRRHFVSHDQKVRITVDSNLRFAKADGPTANKRFISSNEDLVVLEGKTEVGLEHRIRKILAPITGRVQRCSKYVTACHQMGFVPKT